MNLQVIASPAGDIIWVSGPLPGAVHDLIAARIWGIIQALAACGLIALGDKGYLGEEHIRALSRTEQARLAEGRQPRARRAPRPRRTCQCPAQDLAHSAEAPLLPLPRRAAGQGHPRSPDPRNRGMKNGQYIGTLRQGGGT
jgi:hypothetical protein